VATLIRDGISAAPGIVIAPAHLLRWEVPRVPHGSIRPDEAEAEIERFAEARERAKERIREIQEYARERLGDIEANIFDPQLLMIDDPELVETTNSYIRDNLLSAARAFQLRVLEFQSEWRLSGHPMVLDRLNDLLDIQVRILRILLDLPDPEESLAEISHEVVLIARDLTPSLMAQLDRDLVLGIGIDAGSRTSHAAILARSLGIPAVVGLGDLSEFVETGERVILDGRAARVIVEPDEFELNLYRERDIKVREWEEEIARLTLADAVTTDGVEVVIRANIDLPGEAIAAREQGAEGIGLFRTEFLVIGRSRYPGEEEQYAAYRKVVESFPEQPVYIRTFDLGGDKFPLFLEMPPEENPFLGWRAIRVCLDTPELFRTHLRALLRASDYGDLRIMLPMINQIAEIEATRDILREEEENLRAEGYELRGEYELGIMIETPAAALTASELARHADFFSIGTNDLVQYTLAVDRGNSRLASRYTPFHPAVVRQLERISRAGRDAGIEVSVCGELASYPLGVYLLIGLGIETLSVGPASLSEIKKIVRSISAEDAAERARAALEAETVEEVREILTAGISRWLDLSLFSGRWSESGPE